MRRLFVANDGSLRAGRVAALLLLLLLVLGGVVLRCEKPINQVAVKVRHVFHPTPQPVSPPAEQVQPSAPSPADREQQVGEETSPKQEPEIIEEQSAQVNDQPVLPQQLVAIPPFQEKSAPTDEALTVPPKEASSTDSPNDPAEVVSPPENSMVVEEKVESPVVPLPPVTTAASIADVPSEKKQEPPGNVDSMEKVKLEAVEIPRKEERELEVDRATYQNLFSSWRTSGTSEGTDKISLRVVDLRNSYGLFQMKPVAVRSSNNFFDLNDGTRLPPGSLDEYSATVFVVDRPWEKWGSALNKAGLRPGTAIEVRYYMYEFIKRAMYSRCHRAMEWCIEQGTIPADTQVGQVDILGRAYVIRSLTGGQFGVFVPVELRVKNGPKVDISAEAFAGQSDIDALVRGGLL